MQTCMRPLILLVHRWFLVEEVGNYHSVKKVVL